MVMLRDILILFLSVDGNPLYNSYFIAEGIR